MARFFLDPCSWRIVPGVTRGLFFFPGWVLFQIPMEGPLVKSVLFSNDSLHVIPRYLSVIGDIVGFTVLFFAFLPFCFLPKIERFPLSKVLLIPLEHEFVRKTLAFV